MTPCLDIHTHHPAPQPEGVISVSMEHFNPVEGQRYSLGIHPWDSTAPLTLEQWENFEKLAQHPQVVAIGECGIDLVKGAPLYKQLLILQRQIEISEKLGKPIVLHDVKAHDIIVGLRKDLHPAQNWAIHGFRYKPTVAKMLTDVGIFLSFGQNFNPQSLLSMPPHLILAETDESPLTIQEIITQLSRPFNRDITFLIAENSAKFLSGNEILFK